MACPKCVAHPESRHRVRVRRRGGRGGRQASRLLRREKREATVLLLSRAAHLLAPSDVHSVMCERGWHSAVVHRNGRYIIPVSREMTWQDLIRAVAEKGSASSPLVTSAAVLDWCARQTPSRISPSRQGEGLNYEAWWDADEDAARAGNQLLKFKVGRNQTDDNLWARRDLRSHCASARGNAASSRSMERARKRPSPG